MSCGHKPVLPAVACSAVSGTAAGNHCTIVQFVVIVVVHVVALLALALPILIIIVLIVVLVFGIIYNWF